MYRQKKRHDFYDNHFKVTAVKLGALPGVQAQDVAAVLEVHPVMLYRWKKEYREGKFMAESKQGQIHTVFRRELKRLQSVEYETLTKSSRYAIVYGLESAKKPETRERRFNKFMDMLAREETPGFGFKKKT